MTTPKSSSFRGWWNDRASGQLDLYYGSGTGASPVEVQRVDINGTTIVTGDLALDDGTVYLYDGGEETQADSVTTAVTINTNAGQITTYTSTLAAAAEEAFTVTNNQVAVTDVVIANVATYGGAGTPAVFVTTVANGSFQITKANLHAANALDDVMVINFAIIKCSSTT